MKKIKLTQGKYAIVDDEDYPYLSRFKWYLSGDKKFAQRDFIGRNGKHTTFYMHTLLIEGKSGMLIIHKNSNTIDNRKDNLVLVPLQYLLHRKNPKKKQIGKTSKYQGVSWDKENSKWKATIKKDEKHITLGRFNSECKAAKVYNKKAKELYGEFAYQNKIN